MLKKTNDRKGHSKVIIQQATYNLLLVVSSMSVPYTVSKIPFHHN